MSKAVQTNKEQNQSDLMAVNHDYLPKEYTIESIRKFEPQLADWIEQRIHQARIDELVEFFVETGMEEYQRVYYVKRIAELERGSDERI